MTARIINSTLPPYPRVKIEWRWATDAGFTTNLDNYIELDSAYTQVGATHTLVVPVAHKLFTGLWNLEARVVPESTYTQSAWSAIVPFEVRHLPRAINMTPTSVTSQAVQYGTQVFSWTFSDPNPTDHQTAYDLYIYDSTRTIISDTGKIPSLVSSASGISIGAGYKGQQLYWALVLWDEDDVQGPQSDLVPFVVADLPTVVVTAPSGTIGNPQPTITWTYTDPSAAAKYRVAVIDTDHANAVIFDTGLVLGNPLTWTIPSTTPPLVNNTNYQAQVWVQNVNGLQGAGSSNFHTTWSAPADPTFTADTSQVATSGIVTLNWTAAAIDANFISWNVYRRYGATGAWQTLRVETSPTGPYSFIDYAAGADNYYKIVQFADRFGITVPSDGNNVLQVAGGTANGLYTLVLSAAVTGAPSTFSTPFVLEGVTADSFVDEYDSTEVHLMGRGRRVEYATHLGYNGTLTVHLTDTALGTARAKRASLRAMKEEAISGNFDCIMRNPFGDVLTVDLGAMTFDREAGLASREYGILTIPYMEVITAASAI